MPLQEEELVRKDKETLHFGNRDINLNIVKPGTSLLNFLAVSVIVLAAISIVIPGAYRAQAPVRVLASTAVATPTPTPTPRPYLYGTTEHEPNNTWPQAQANGYLNLAQNTTYSGTLDGNTTTGDDNYLVRITTPVNRKFSLTIPSGNYTGVTLALYSMPTGTLVAYDNDQVLPYELSYSFVATGDYEFKVFTNPTANNRSPYTFTIADPNVYTCAWGSAIANTILPGSGALQTAGNFVYNNTLFQMITRGTQFWVRTVPFGTNGLPNFPAATAWVSTNTVSTYPGAGPLLTETEYVIGNTIYQGIWRGNLGAEQGFSRQIPIVNGVPQWNCYAPFAPTPTPAP